MAQLVTLPNREILGTGMGVLHAATVGTGWSDFSSGNFYVFSGSLATSDAISKVEVKNRSTAAVVLYVLGRPGGTVDVSRSFRLRAGESYTFDLAAVDGGFYPTTISLQGSVSPTTVDVTGWFTRPTRA